MKSFIYISFFIFLSFRLLPIKSVETPSISDLRLCADQKCSVPISQGLAQINYFSNVKHGVSFSRGNKVTVYSKGAGKKSDLWGVEVNGKRGYAPKKLITEKKILVKNEDLKHTVPTELTIQDESKDTTETVEGTAETVQVTTGTREQLSINEDSLIDKNIEDIREVQKIISHGNVLSSFILPGSFAENPVSPDIKDKITPKKVEEIVVDGTTLYNSDLSYSDDPSPLDYILKPGESAVTNTDKEIDKTENQPELKPQESQSDSVIVNATEDDSSVTEQNGNNNTPSNISESTAETEKFDSPKKSSEVGSETQTENKASDEKPKPDLAAKDDKATVDNMIKEDEEIDEFEDDEDEDADDGGEAEDEEETDANGEEAIVEESIVDVVAKEESVSSDSGDTSDKLSQENEAPTIESVGDDNKGIAENSNVSDHVISESDQEKKLIDEPQPPKEEIKDQNNQPIVSQVTEDVNGTVESAEIFDNISAQVSNNFEETSKPSSPDEINFIQHPEIKSELFGILPPKGQVEFGIVKDSETTSSKLTTETTSSDDSETEKLLESGSRTSPKLDINDKLNETEGEILGSSEHIDSAIPAEVDEHSKDEKGSEEATTFQPLEVTEEFITDLPSPVISDFVIEKEIEATTQSYVDGFSSPISPATQDQIEISTEKTYTDPFSSEIQEQHQIIPEEGSTPDSLYQEVEEETASAKIEEHQPSVLTEETKDVDISESGSWLSLDFITNFFSSSPQSSEEIIDATISEETPVDSEQSVWTEKLDFTTEQAQYCSGTSKKGQDDACQQFESVKEENLSASDEEKQGSWDAVKELLSASQNVSVSTDSLIYLIIMAVTVILFSLGYYYIENHRNDSALVAKINKLERDYLVVKKESANLHEKLQTAESQVSLSQDSLTDFNEQLAALTQELEETKAAKIELEEQYVILEKEFDAATESGLEMHRLLTESLSTQDGSQVLLKTVESLRTKLDHQDGEIKELKQLLNEKSQEIEKLHDEMKINQETRKALQEKLTNLRREKEEELLQLKDSNRTLSTQLGDLMEEKSLIEMKLSNDISKLRLLVEETQTTLADREGEIDALREAIAKLNRHDKEENLDALYDTAKVNGKLAIAERERDSYKERFFEEEGARKLLEDHVQMTRQEVKSLKENYETAEKEKIEALTKLQVLSNYFKEKESELQKELGLQESMWLQKQSDDHTIYEQMKSLREENEKYKLQNESLKKEICESESAFKIQIANVEQKAHDNWVTSRQLERRLKETQNEATQLRNRLTLVEKNATNSSSDDLKQNMSYGIGETNGDPSSPPPSLPLFPPAASPPFMMFGGSMPPPPPPTSEFLPPPPPPLGFPEGRPAPVGRISSPPLDHSFSPPPPLSFFYDSTVYGGHHSPSPPPHRPMPKPIREMGLEQKDRVSPPRHSEQQERPGRRSKR